MDWVGWGACGRRRGWRGEGVARRGGGEGREGEGVKGGLGGSSLLRAEGQPWSWCHVGGGSGGERMGARHGLGRRWGGIQVLYSSTHAAAVIATLCVSSRGMTHTPIVPGGSGWSLAYGRGCVRRREPYLAVSVSRCSPQRLNQARTQVCDSCKCPRSTAFGWQAPWPAHSRSVWRAICLCFAACLRAMGNGRRGQRQTSAGWRRLMHAHAPRTTLPRCRYRYRPAACFCALAVCCLVACRRVRPIVCVCVRLRPALYLHLLLSTTLSVGL